MIDIKNLFVEFLAYSWEKEFKHSYKITKNSAWSTWIQEKKLDTWECENLKDACLKYSWGKPSDNQKYLDLSSSLQLALISENNELTASLCNQIFQWGRVSTNKNDRTKIWVDDQKNKGTLTKKIKVAINLLSPHSDESLERFNGEDLLMNSSITKVYAAADTEKNIVIYDGRVGAALGLIARKLLESHNIDKVPTELNFLWGQPTSKLAAKLKTRDPSSDNLIFEKLPYTSSNKNADLIRANISRVTNYYLFQTVHLLKNRGINTTPLDFERALFMIGYNIHQLNKK